METGIKDIQGTMIERGHALEITAECSLKGCYNNIYRHAGIFYLGYPENNNPLTLDLVQRYGLTIMIFEEG